jgi:hypothetical protein
MKKIDIAQAKNPDLRGSLAALQRAAAGARQIAIQTNTSLVLVKDGQLVKVSAEELKREANKPQ